MLNNPLTRVTRFLDRTNIGNARIQGLDADLGLTDFSYRMILTIVYIPYVLVELPVTMVLKRVGAHICIPVLVTVWGLASTMQVSIFCLLFKDLS